MVLTEPDIHFVKNGDRWRCVEWPGLTMLPGERYEVEAREFDSLAEALAQLTGAAALRSPGHGGRVRIATIPTADIWARVRRVQDGNRLSEREKNRDGLC